MNGTVTSLAYFPIKGMTAHRLDSVTLTPGAGFPGDRQWGFARPGSGFDPTAPCPLPKHKFVVLVREAELAGVTARLHGDDLHLSHSTGSLDVDLSQEAQRAAAAAFLQQCLGLDDAPTLVQSDPHRFTDVSVVSPELMNAVSILSLSSVADFGSRIGERVDPGRFRMNCAVEGWPPWEELEDIGREIQLGTVRLKTLLRTQRCAATEVNPATANRDLPVPRLLRQHLGHLDLGVYAEVIEGGEIRPGDPAVLL
ncbi:MAG: MOSC domain-containing protein [Pseudomonadota bacterium]